MSDDAPNSGNPKPRTIIKKSGHPIVDAIFQIEHEAKQNGVTLFGDFLLVPDIWSHVVVGKTGRCHQLAVRVLAEIWFRHKPIYGKPDDKGVIHLSKAFSGDRYQLNRAELAAKFNAHPDTITEASNLLEELGLIGKELQDTDINHRGFRNMLFVWPIPEKLMELVDEALKKVYNINLESKTQQIPAGETPPRAGETPARGGKTLPRGGETPARGGKTPVFQEYSNNSSPSLGSGSASGEARTQSEPPEGNNNKKSSASPAAPPRTGDDVAPSALSLSVWSASPPPLTGKDGRIGTVKEKAGVIRHYVGRFYKQWFQKEPSLPADEFERLVEDHNSEVNLKAGQWVLCISAGWLWANDGPSPDAGKTFDPTWYADHVGEELQNLFNKTRGGKLYICGLWEELKLAVNSLEIDMDWTANDVLGWWEREMEARDVVRDPKSYYREDGDYLRNPFTTTWVELYHVLEDAYRWEKEGTMPEEKWFTQVAVRYKKGPEEGPKGMHMDHRKLVGQILAHFGHLSGVEAPARIPWK